MPLALAACSDSPCPVEWGLIDNNEFSGWQDTQWADMKIPISLIRDAVTPTGDHEHLIEQHVQAWRDGDWEAKTRLVQATGPLLLFLARKRGGTDAGLVNLYVEAGKEGLARAVRRFRPTNRVKFHVFALSHIEKAMDKAAKELSANRRLNN